MRVLAWQIVQAGIGGHLPTALAAAPLGDLINKSPGHALAALWRRDINPFQKHHRRSVRPVDVIAAQRSLGQTDGNASGILGNEVDCARGGLQQVLDFIPVSLYRSLWPECLAQG